MSKTPLIYVAGPYSGRGLPWPISWAEQAVNILRAARIAVGLMRRGWAVICPHTMTCLFPLLSAYHLDWNDFMRADLRILQSCDALFYIAPSKGADIELAAAESWGLPVYSSLDEVPEGNSL